MKKDEYLSDERFAALEASRQQALQHARGKRHDLRTTVRAAAPKQMKKQELVALRQQLNLSQSLFASLFKRQRQNRAGVGARLARTERCRAWSC